MSDTMEFTNRDEFRKWLYEHCLSSSGVWLLFGKAGGPQTIKAPKRLKKRSALDGSTVKCSALTTKLIKNIFPCEENKASGSEKNKAIAKSLEARGLMTGWGRRKIEEAQKNGQWHTPAPAAITEAQIAELSHC